MSNLFDDIDEGKRKRLLARGWRQVGGWVKGRMCWENPENGAHLEELEAFKILERLEKDEAEKESNP